MFAWMLVQKIFEARGGDLLEDITLCSVRTIRWPENIKNVRASVIRKTQSVSLQLHSSGIQRILIQDLH